ncbi:hypothetical protein BJF77_10185 [Kocuria sp. CNJ-770]|uniref:PASTA domain-containing protein n=2 Tax=unclassified Kocuria TaxID=2649579 RepID=UPI00095A1870|nr:PASTA domain-containing protein [Kocuria sp. CNJ-770]OLT09545.1 hypothetical protein BJF77_10185 [Kocuria sp. CNJ-770]
MLGRGAAGSPVPGGTRTEVLGRQQAPTETLRRHEDPTEALRPAGAATEALPAPRPAGSSDPWRPAIELRPRRPLRAAAHLALAALAVAAAAFLGWLIGTGPGGTVSVPEVRGTGPELAQQYLAGAGLRNVAVHETPDPAAPAGTVIGTDPAASATVRPAEQVVLLVSTGPEQVTAPDVVGMSAEDAAARLGDADLAAGARTAVSDDAAAGTVVGQHPEAGTEVAAGSAVDLAVSRGPRAESAPDVVGRPVGEAVPALEEAGFTARVEESFGAPFGYVLSQTTDGAEVVLTVL